MISLRTFFCGWKTMMYTLGMNRHSSATVALREMDTHNVVIWICEHKMNILL